MTAKYVALCCGPICCYIFFFFFFSSSSSYGVISCCGQWRQSAMSFWSAHCGERAWVGVPALNAVEMTGVAFTLMFTAFNWLARAMPAPALAQKQGPFERVHPGKIPEWHGWHTPALNGSSLSEWGAWDIAIPAPRVRSWNRTCLAPLNILQKEKWHFCFYLPLACAHFPISAPEEMLKGGVDRLPWLISARVQKPVCLLKMHQRDISRAQTQAVDLGWRLRRLCSIIPR